MVSNRKFLEKRTALQRQQKCQYDVTSRLLPSVEVGKSVYVQKTPGGKWSPARVIAQSEAPRSYVVETDDGSVIRRNRVHLSSRLGIDSETRDPGGPTVISLVPFSTPNKEIPAQKSLSPPGNQLSRSPLHSSAPLDRMETELTSFEASIQPCGAAPLPQVSARTRSPRVINPPKRLNL